MINEITWGTDIVDDKMKSKTLDNTFDIKAIERSAASMEICLSDKRLKAVIAWHNEEWHRLEKEKIK